MASKKSIIIASVIGAILVASIILGVTLTSFDLDDGGGEIELVNGEGFEEPAISIESIAISDIIADSFKCALYIKGDESVDIVRIYFFVDQEYVFVDDMGMTDAGFYSKTFNRVQFGGAAIIEESIITINILAYYTKPDDINQYVVSAIDPIDGFCFVHVEVPPAFSQPEIIPGTFESTSVEGVITFSLLISNVEFVREVYYYFVIDGDSVLDSEGNVYVLGMFEEDNGKYSTSFNYLQFEDNSVVYIYVMIVFTNANGFDEQYTYEEYCYFDTATSKTVRNILIGIGASLVVVSTIVIIIRRKNTNDASSKRK